MNKKTLTWIGIYAVGAYGLWYIFKKYHLSGRDRDILTIEAQNYGGFEDAYLDAWAKAIKSGASTFVYKGATYNTKGGKAVR
jgi:hypothetical protein